MAMVAALVRILCLSVSVSRAFSAPPPPLPPSSPPLSFSLTYVDAESSLVRSVEADPNWELPGAEAMPLRGFVAAGRAMRLRVDKQRKWLLRRLLKGKVSYLNENVGDFYLTLPIGTPPQHIIFLLDTGSEFTWSQCSPCQFCTATPAPLFAPNRSSSLLFIPCASSLCVQSLGLHTRACINTTTTTQSCIFDVAYGDGSVDAGSVLVDSFHLGPHFSKPIIFGCAIFVNDTAPTPSSGILGLSAGPFSFLSQLFSDGNVDIPKKFAHCLPDRITDLNSPGTILFGNYELPANLSYTPLAPPYSPLGDLYYYVDLQAITVGGSSIKVAVLEGDDQKGVVETGGTIFDSGSALTTLVKWLYDELVEEMKKQTAHLQPFASQSAGSDLCYKVSLDAEELPKVPLVTLHFAGKVELELGPGSLLYAAESDDKWISFCWAFLSDSGSGNENIIGNYQQQNYWVEYNLQTSSLGLAKARCPKRA